MSIYRLGEHCGSGSVYAIADTGLNKKYMEHEGHFWAEELRKDQWIFIAKY